MGNPFVYVQLHTQDLPKAREFYQGLLDWTFQETQTGDNPYTEVFVGEGTRGGMMKSPTPDSGSRWHPYIHVDDIDAYTEKARALGATVILEPTEVPGMGWYSVIVDPTGAPFSLVTHT